MSSNLPNTQQEAKPILLNNASTPKSVLAPNHPYMKFSDKYNEIFSSSESEIESKQNKVLKAGQDSSLDIVRPNGEHTKNIREGLNPVHMQMTPEEEALFSKIEISDSSYGDTEQESEAKPNRESLEYQLFIKSKVAESKRLQGSFTVLGDNENKENISQGKVAGTKKGLQYDYTVVSIGESKENRRLIKEDDEIKSPSKTFGFESKRSFMNTKEFQRDFSQKVEESKKEKPVEVKKQVEKPALRIITNQTLQQPILEANASSEVSSILLNKSSLVESKQAISILSHPPSEPVPPQVSTPKPPHTQTSEQASPFEISPEDLYQEAHEEVQSTPTPKQNPRIPSIQISPAKVEPPQNAKSPTIFITSIDQTSRTVPKAEINQHFPVEDKDVIMKWDTKELSSDISSESSSSIDIKVRDTLKFRTLTKIIEDGHLDEDPRMPPALSLDMNREYETEEGNLEIPRILTRIQKEILHKNGPVTGSSGEVSEMKATQNTVSNEKGTIPIKDRGKISPIPESDVESLDGSKENIKEIYKQDTFNPNPTQKANTTITTEYLRIQPPIISEPKDDDQRDLSSNRISRAISDNSFESRSPGDLLYIQDVLRNIEYENIGNEIAKASAMLKKPSFMNWCTSCFTGNSNRIAKEEERQARNRLFAMSLVKYSDSNLFHQKLLMSIWRLYTGAHSNCPRIGSHWKDLGFTQEDPTEQLGASNIFGLICMVFLACRFKDDVIKIIDRSRDPRFSFKFANISLKMSEITLKAVEHKRVNPTINREHSAYEAILMFYAGLFIAWFDQYVGKNFDEARGNHLSQVVYRLSKQSPDQVFMLAKSRFDFNKLRQSS
jgi:hypothetical protein